MSRSLHTWTPSDYDGTHMMCNILSPPNSQHGCGKGIWSPTLSEKLLTTDGYCRRKSQFSSGTWATGGHPCLTDGPTLNAHRQHWVFSGSFRRKTTWSCKGKVMVVDRKKGGVNLIKTHMNVWSSHTIKSQLLFHCCKKWPSFTVPTAIPGDKTIAPINGSILFLI